VLLLASEFVVLQEAQDC